MLLRAKRRLPNVPPHTPSLEYLAAFLDGEGWIGVIEGGGSGKGVGRYRVGIKVSQVYLHNVLYALHGEFGGTLHLTPYRGAHADHLLRWEIRGNEAERLLRRVYPYLIGKRYQALVALGLHGKSAKLAKNRRWADLLSDTKRTVMS